MLTTRRHLVVSFFFFFFPTKFQKQSEFRFHVTDGSHGAGRLASNCASVTLSSTWVSSESSLRWQTSVLGHFIYIHIYISPSLIEEMGKPWSWRKSTQKVLFFFKQILAARPGSGRLDEKGVQGESSGGQVFNVSWDWKRKTSENLSRIQTLPGKPIQLSRLRAVDLECRGCCERHLTWQSS